MAQLLKGIYTQVQVLRTASLEQGLRLALAQSGEAAELLPDCQSSCEDDNAKYTFWTPPRSDVLNAGKLALGRTAPPFLAEIWESMALVVAYPSSSSRSSSLLSGSNH